MDFLNDKSFDYLLGAVLIGYAFYRLIKVGKNIQPSNIVSSLFMVIFGIGYVIFMTDTQLINQLWMQIVLGTLLGAAVIFGILHVIKCKKNNEKVFKKLW